MSDEPILLANRYRVERELGRGGMAKVYRGTDTVLGRPVAIKLLATQYAEDADFVARFRREAQAAARLNHPNLVGVYDTGTDEGVHFIVMEYVEGRTLADFLEGGGRVAPGRAAEIADLVLRALQAAHAQGVIHRDIKPANIMITPAGEVKVTDFGIARLSSGTETLAATSAVLGTASYLAPEQARSEPVDGRADLYALGCVLYEMVTGRPPFTGDSAVSVASKHVLEIPEPPSALNRDVSADLEAVILRALAKDPQDRYATADEMRRDLGRAMRGEPVAAPGPEATATQVLPRGASAGGRGGAPAPRRKRSWAQTLVLLLTAVGAIAGLFLLTRAIVGDRVSQVVVPSVLDLQLTDARDILEGATLTVAPSIVEVVDTTREPGTVIEQDPAAGATVAEGTAVVLTVVVLPESVEVPEIVGLSETDAKAALREAGFVVGDVVSEASEVVPLGQAVGTDPSAGSPLAYGATVTLRMSSGVGTVVVPDVRCQSFGTASSALRDAGLNPTISETTVAQNPLCPNTSRVASQDPLPGTEVDAGTTVILYGGSTETSPSPTTSPTASPTP
ncbi:MAG: Stk1 family PASTA domain-containing Ser/Thr kinase [Actinomycetota bacterium]